MKRNLLTGMLTIFLCLAPIPVVAQTGQPGSGQDRYQAFQEAQQQYWRKTADLRQQVLRKQYELAATLVNPKASEDELLKKQRELQDVRNKLEKEQLAFTYQMRRKYPEVFESYGMVGGGYGMGPGMMGYGLGMGTCGMGYGMMGGGYGMGQGMPGGYHHMGPGMMGGWGQ